MKNILRHKDLIHKSFDGTDFDTRSIQLNDYMRDPEFVELSSTRLHYIGFTKPFYWLFCEISELNSESAQLTMEYYNGTSWVDLPNLFDDTKTFQRSGFIRWEFSEDDKVRDDWKPTTVDSEELFWIRISTDEALGATQIGSSLTGSTDTIINLSNEDVANFSVGTVVKVGSETAYSIVSAVDPTSGAANITLQSALSGAPADGTLLRTPPKFQGINIVFCDDQDMLTINPRANDFKFKSQASFMNYRLEATNQIVRTLRNGGWVKMFSSNSQISPSVGQSGLAKLRSITKWDILDVDEIRDAAKYLALSKLFFEVSENNEDKSYMRYKDYRDKYSEAFKMFFISLDLDDDGEVDRYENHHTNELEIIRW